MVMRVPAAVTTTVTIMRINIGGQGYGILLNICRFLPVRTVSPIYYLSYIDETRSYDKMTTACNRH
jgi:hypothetical protein